MANTHRAPTGSLRMRSDTESDEVPERFTEKHARLTGIDADPNELCRELGVFAPPRD
jgi:hypothetical protein